MARITKAALELQIADLQRRIDDLTTVVEHQKRELALYQMIERPSRRVEVASPEDTKHAMATGLRDIIRTSHSYREVLDAARELASITGVYVQIPSGAAVRARAAA